MSVNSSSSPLESFYHCSDSTDGLIISIAFVVTRTLLILPPSIFVFYLALQRWRQQRSFAATSHSDIFTYQVAAIELLSALGGSLYFCGVYTGLPELLTVGLYASTFSIPGQVLFNALTCVERYLAVVHPITYLSLRQSGGVKIRNISIACVWMLCCGWNGVIALYMPHIPVVPFAILLMFSLIVVSFCSIRVLCILIRPGPGEVGGDRKRVDQSKQRAFNTIMAVMGVLWLWFAGILVGLALDSSPLLSPDVGCLVLVSVSWLILPSCLVLPLLFLHRAGKQSCCN